MGAATTSKFFGTLLMVELFLYHARLWCVRPLDTGARLTSYIVVYSFCFLRSAKTIPFELKLSRRFVLLSRLAYCSRVLCFSGFFDRLRPSCAAQVVQLLLKIWCILTPRNSEMRTDG